MKSDLPTLQVREGLAVWGEVRLSSHNHDNIIVVELKPLYGDWRPIYQFISLHGRIAMRVMAEKNDRVLVYDAATNSFSDLAGVAKVGNDPNLRRGEVGQDNPSGEDNSQPKADPGDGGR